jgi:hypothetical protein
MDRATCNIALHLLPQTMQEGKGTEGHQRLQQ